MMVTIMTMTTIMMMMTTIKMVMTTTTTMILGIFWVASCLGTSLLTITEPDDDDDDVDDVDDDDFRHFLDGQLGPFLGPSANDHGTG